MCPSSQTLSKISRKAGISAPDAFVNDPNVQRGGYELQGRHSCDSYLKTKLPEAPTFRVLERLLLESGNIHRGKTSFTGTFDTDIPAFLPSCRKRATRGTIADRGSFDWALVTNVRSLTSAKYFSDSALPAGAL